MEAERFVQKKIPSITKKLTESICCLVLEEFFLDQLFQNRFKPGFMNWIWFGVKGDLN